MEVLLGNYYGFNNQMITMLEGVTGRIPEGMGLEYHPGALLKDPREIKQSWAPHMAQSADVSIVCVGSTPQMEGEEGESADPRAFINQRLRTRLARASSVSC